MLVILALVAVFAHPHLLEAQTPAAPTQATPAATSPRGGEDPPPPVPPAVINRGERRATIRATRLQRPLRIDGRLDEPMYTEILSITDFIQQEPIEGGSASEKTEVWLTFDDDNVYVSVRCWETHPERTVRREMRRDNTVIFRAGHDAIGFMFDTFHDRRSGYIFNVNPVGGRTDGQFPNERQYNGDWNPIWDVRTGRFEEGWTVEAAIPFKSLRYQPQREQVWGFNLRRTSGWRNELSYITRVPAGRSTGGTQMAAVAATVVGLEAPPLARNIEIKPYAASSASTVAKNGNLVNDVRWQAGGDLKYSITQNLTADVTVKTDFAQVEADEQQVNLTRFSLFFPEKREFFLENATLFAFGGASATTATASNTPVLFYSRQIGLNRGQAVPLRAGGRVTGRVGKFSIGALNIETGTEPTTNARPTNLSVLRLKRDTLRRSAIGALFTRRSESTIADGANQAYGLDGTFAFFSNLNINTYWAQTSTPGVSQSPFSYRADFDYRGDRYGLELERLVVGEGFNPEVGFLRRQAFNRHYGYARFSPRLHRGAVIRKLTWDGHIDYIEGRRSHRLETRELQGGFAAELRSSDQLAVAYTRSYEYLAQPFVIASNVTIPVGGYAFEDVRATYTMGLQRAVSGVFSVQRGTFYAGYRTTYSASGARVNIATKLSVEPTLSVNTVEQPQGSFTTNLAGARVSFSMTPFMFVAALVQYQSDRRAVSTNLRFRWEYLPGSELFIVMNEERDTRPLGFPVLQNRSLIVKFNRLFRF